MECNWTMQRSNHALCKQYQSFRNTIKNYGQAFLSSLADRAQRRSKVTRGARLQSHAMRPVDRESGRGCLRASVGKLTVHTSALEIKCLTDTGPRTARKKGVGRCVLQSAAYGDASARKGRSDTCKSQQQRTHAHRHAPMCTHTYTRTHTPTCASAHTHARI